MVNLQFYCFHFSRIFCDILAEVVHLVFVIWTLSSLPTFVVGNSRLFLSQLYLLNLEDIFFFLRHWFVEGGIVLSCSAPRSSRIYIGFFLRRIGMIAGI
ncbi:hypothetical protein DY000_02030317 [Brassica cretica]|uniref:Uncharacterized protein n=1 Tax=Brassica cretica TaxID=69181 RepID=A0ABQ7DMH1_BRACR|nr:hypothetical protein DY000_02030317 [Brassica cretica]